MFTHKRHRASSLLDKFYTRDHIAERCLRVLGNLDDYDCVIEPAAGAGAFLRHIQHSNVIALDISPASAAVSQADWLRYKIGADFKRVLVVGNPPYGLNHALSDAFIRRALSFGNVQTVGFILPNTYRKHTRQRVLPRSWRIARIEDLGDDAFTYDGGVYHMPCSFFVFDKSAGADMRVRIEPTMYREAADFQFSDKSDFDFFMFGAAPNKLTANPTRNNRGYYIKSKIDASELKRRIKAVDWRGNSCANGGVAWFTKPEIVAQYNNFIADSGLTTGSSPRRQLQL